jgi:hypothetical protein
MLSTASFGVAFQLCSSSFHGVFMRQIALLFLIAASCARAQSSEDLLRSAEQTSSPDGYEINGKSARAAPKLRLAYDRSGDDSLRRVSGVSYGKAAIPRALSAASTP